MRRLLLVLMFTLWLLGSGFGQLMAQGACLVTDWDIVIGGSQITSSLTQGECEYEVDTEDGSPNSLLALNIDETFEASLAHEVSFIFKGDRLNNTQKGRFSIMTLDSTNREAPQFSLELSWSGARQSRDVLVLEGKVSPELDGSPWATQPLRPGQGPIAIQDGFVGAIEVLVRFTESSGAGADDGRIEIWVDGYLEAAWDHLSLDWAHSEAPVSVSYGVVQVFETETSGSLRFIPFSPRPHSPGF